MEFAIVSKGKFPTLKKAFSYFRFQVWSHYLFWQ